MMLAAAEERDAVVPAEQAASLARWQMPVFDVSGTANVQDALPTAAQMEAVEAAAYQEGFERGRSEGHAAGNRAVQAEAQRLRGLIEQIARPLAHLDDEVEHVLLDLAVAVARRLLGEELTLAPERVATIARDALLALPPYVRDVRLHLHPEDAALVGAQLTPPPEAQNFRVVTDPALARGDCRLFTESAQIDARLDARLNVIAQSLSGESA